MQFEIETRVLRDAVHTIGNLPAANGPTAVTFTADGFGGLTLTRATHLARISTTRDEVTVLDDGKASVAFDKFKKLVDSWTASRVDVRLNNQSVHFTSGDSVAKLALWPEEELYAVPPPVEGLTITFDSRTLLEAVRIAKAGMYLEGGRDELKGIVVRAVLGRICVIGSDGRRVHAWKGEDTFEDVCKRPDKNFDEGLMIPRESIIAVERVLIGTIGSDPVQAQLTVSPNAARLTAGGREIHFAVGAKGPGDVTPFIRFIEPDEVFKVKREALHRLVKSALSLVENDTLTIEFTKGSITVIGDDQRGNIYSDTIDAENTKGGCAVRVNGDYLREFLESASAETIELGYIRSYNAFTHLENDRYLILMLIRDGVIDAERYP